MYCVDIFKISSNGLQASEIIHGNANASVCWQSCFFFNKVKLLHYVSVLFISSAFYCWTPAAFGCLNCQIKCVHTFIKWTLQSFLTMSCCYVAFIRLISYDIVLSHCTVPHSIKWIVASKPFQLDVTINQNLMVHRCSAFFNPAGSLQLWQQIWSNP